WQTTAVPLWLLHFPAENRVPPFPENALLRSAIRRHDDWPALDRRRGTSPVKIKHIEPIAVSLPMTKPVKMAGEEVTRADNVLVRIETHDGGVGWGEAASAPTMTGETVASMVAAVRHLAPILQEWDAEDVDGALTAMHGRMYGNHGAKAAI